MRLLWLWLIFWGGLAFAQQEIPRPQLIGAYVQGTLLSLDLEAGKARVRLDGGKEVVADVAVGGPVYRIGQRVVVWRTGAYDYLENPVRYPALAWLLALFIGAALVLGRIKGLRAVLGTLASLLVLLYFVLPQISRGSDPLLTTLGGAVGILAFSTYFVHGINRKTSAALIGTLLATLVGLALVVYFARALHLTGLIGDEQSISLYSFGVNPLSLYLASVILGALGALNDMTVTQAAVVQTLAHSSPHLSFRELYRRAMDVGLDHMGSMVNTLVLAYTAGSLPLLLLILRDPSPFWYQVNGEAFAAEIARILIGSSCLLLAVPLTTLIAALFFRRQASVES